MEAPTPRAGLLLTASEAGPRQPPQCACEPRAFVSSHRFENEVARVAPGSGHRQGAGRCREGVVEGVAAAPGAGRGGRGRGDMKRGQPGRAPLPDFPPDLISIRVTTRREQRRRTRYCSEAVRPGTAVRPHPAQSGLVAVPGRQSRTGRSGAGQGEIPLGPDKQGPNDQARGPARPLSSEDQSDIDTTRTRREAPSRDTRRCRVRCIARPPPPKKKNSRTGKKH